MENILDWSDAELAAFLELPNEINPPQNLSDSTEGNCFIDSNLTNLLVTVDFIILFKSTIRPKTSRKTFFAKRLIKVQEIIETQNKFTGFRPYFRYLITLSKSDPKIQRFMLDSCTECLYAFYKNQNQI